MNCPYCNEKMQNGYIMSSYGLARWYAEGERPKLSLKKSGIRLSNSSVTKTQIIESYLCKDCSKVIISLPD